MIINIININAGISINVIILRVTHWLHVPWRSNENVPAIFWDKQPLRELLQHARDGIKPAPGSSMDNVTTCIMFFCQGFFQRWPCRWDGHRRSFCWVSKGCLPIQNRNISWGGGWNFKLKKSWNTPYPLFLRFGSSHNLGANLNSNVFNGKTPYR